MSTFFSKSGASPPTAQQVRERSRLIRRATPNGDTLRNLWDMQNRLCDLCGHECQDLLVCELEHSVPVILFARGPLPIEDAIRECNDPSNLRCAHASCNTAKNGLTREEWFTRGLNDREKPRILTEGQLLELQFRLGAGGRVGGRIAGRNAKKTKTGIFGMTHEQHQAAGRISGRKTLENGTGLFGRTPEQRSKDAQKAGRTGGLIQGRRCVENGHLARICVLGGRIAGRAAAKSGQIASIATPESRAKGGRMGGRIAGRKNVESGHLTRLAHNRWHVARDIVNVECELCQVAR